MFGVKEQSNRRWLVVLRVRTGKHCRCRRGENRQQIVRTSPADPAEDQQHNCSGDAGELPVMLAPPLHHQASDAQACRYRLLVDGDFLSIRSAVALA
jgi:hypothetical protein